MKFNSIRFKIGVLYIVVLGIVLIIYSTILYFSLHYTLYDELDKELSSKAQEVASSIDTYEQSLMIDEFSLEGATQRIFELIHDYSDPDNLSQIERQWLQKVEKFDLRKDYLSFLNIEGEIIAKTSNMSLFLPKLSQKDIDKLQEGNQIFRNIYVEKRDMREINAPFFYRPDKLYIIQVATSLKPLIYLLRARLLHIGISIPIVLLFACLFTNLFANRILKPVVEITRTASYITHRDLSARVKAEHIDEEMKYLVDAFNDMISRLEKSFKYISEFSAHVAHDLKTPLAIIKGEADIALRKDRNIEEYKRALMVNLEEVEKMLKVIDDLLLLTKLDYRPEFFEFENFDFAEFLWEICEQTKILAERKNIKVKVNLPYKKIPISANRLHLRRLFFNIIDNAIKFTPQHGDISIDAKREDRKICITILDTGIGIAKEDLPHIFERFYRVDKTSGCLVAGSGLGLSIVQAIAKLHQATIEVKSFPNKATIFQVRLPIL